MKIQKETIGSLLKYVRRTGDPESVDESGMDMKVWYLDDMAVSFRKEVDKQSFFGLSFEALGRDFQILGNLDLLVVEEDEETGEMTPYEIQDARFVRYIEDYLKWRTRLLSEFNS